MQFPFQTKKLISPGVETASGGNFKSSRLFIADKRTKQKCLIDTGSDFSIWPSRSTDNKLRNNS